MFLVCYNIKRNVLRLLNNLHIILSDNSPSSTFCNIKSSINIVTNIIITIKIYLYQNALSNSILWLHPMKRNLQTHSFNYFKTVRYIYFLQLFTVCKSHLIYFYQTFRKDYLFQLYWIYKCLVFYFLYITAQLYFFNLEPPNAPDFITEIPSTSSSVRPEQ